MYFRVKKTGNGEIYGKQVGTPKIDRCVGNLVGSVTTYPHGIPLGSPVQELTAVISNIADVVKIKHSMQIS